MPTIDGLFNELLKYSPRKSAEIPHNKISRPLYFVGLEDKTFCLSFRDDDKIHNVANAIEIMSAHFNTIIPSGTYTSITIESRDKRFTKLVGDASTVGYKVKDVVCVVDNGLANIVRQCHVHSLVQKTDLIGDVFYEVTLYAKTYNIMTRVVENNN